MTRRVTAVWLALAVWLAGMGTALAQDQAAALEELKREMKALRQEVSAKNKKIDDLERRLDAMQKTTPAKEPVKAAPPKPSPPLPRPPWTRRCRRWRGRRRKKARWKPPREKPPWTRQSRPCRLPRSSGQARLWSIRLGGATLRLIDVSFGYHGRRGEFISHRPATPEWAARRGPRSAQTGFYPATGGAFPGRGRRPVF